MKSTSINWSHKQTESRPESGRPGSFIGQVFTASNELFNLATVQVIRASAVTLLVMAILVGALLGTQYLAGTGIMEAMTWAAGFVFLGLAIESTTHCFKSLLLTGLALPVLALLSADQAIEFTLVAAALLAAWSATGVLKAWKL